MGDDDYQTLSEEIAAEFAALLYGETGGADPLTYAAEQACARWHAYEAERSQRLERDPAARAARREQWARANAKRKRRRRGEHLTNADRVRLHEEVRRRGVHGVAREEGLSMRTASRLGQLVLFEGMEAA
ncbi:MAG TPA: hypothetical protein VFS15_19800 [Kofleriaceae bacterium]|nr:hypothetical protein [Kofleriaceae bacterium]